MDISKVKRIPKLGWLVLIVLILLLTATYFSWVQARQRIETESKSALDAQVTATTTALKDRISAYIDMLYGFRGLYHSSQLVEEKEFHDYFNSLDLNQNYPGFNTIDFATYVKQADLPGFIAATKADKSFYAQGSPDFKITPEGTRDEYVASTYIGVPENSLPKGSDLLTDETRRPTLESARASGKPASSETVGLRGKDNRFTGQLGFLLTIPIYNDKVPDTPEERNAQNRGFVNAIFDYKKLLNEVFQDLPEQISLEVYNDDKIGSPVYARGPSDKTSFTTVEKVVAIADRQWRVKVSAPPNFGLTRRDSVAPESTLFIGILISLLLVSLFASMVRSRSKALRLAADMTRDLKTEKNSAVSLKNKDEAILSSIGDGVFALDNEGRIILFNKAAESLTGFKAEEVLGKSYEKILKFRDGEGIGDKSDFIKKAQSGKNARMERHTTVVQKNGNLLMVADSASPIFDSRGQQQGVIVVFRDVTREIKFQQAMEESSERFDLVAQATNDIIYDLDFYTAKVWWNETLYKKLGYNKNEDNSTVDWRNKHIHPDDQKQVDKELGELIRSRRNTWVGNYRFKRADGTYVYVSDRAFILRNKDHLPTRMIGSMLDVTHQKELERAKDEFISLVSHQLRTPLTAIRLFSEMLAKGEVGKLNTEQQDYVEKVQESSLRMIRLVGDILNVSRIELGRLKIEPVPTDVNKLIQSQLDEQKPVAQQTGVTINFKPVKIDDVLVDPLIFSQIVHNFLTNAVRYSRGGDGRVSVSFTKEKDGYVFSVKDSGIGIPAIAQKRIFERFYRADNAVKTEGEGTGLGLYLVKIIMDTVGGKAWFTSKEGEGSTFYAKIPLTGMKSKEGEKSLS